MSLIKLKGMKHHFELRENIHSPILYGTSYEPASVVGVVLFIHDVNENRFRYEKVAKYFNERHLAFVTYDLRGHHKSLIDDKKGHFGDDEGAELLLSDALDVLDYMKNRYYHVPFILMGQGFGAHLAKLVFDVNPDQFNHLVLVNPTSLPSMSSLRHFLLNVLTYRKPRKKVLSLNKWMGVSFYDKDEQKRYAFLSNDKDIVHQYIQDPFCGYSLTQRAIRDALRIMIESQSIELNPSNSEIGVTIIGGKEDPLTLYGRDLVTLKRNFIQAGYSNTTLSIFEYLKHDVLLEIDGSYQLNHLLETLCYQFY